jgi:hypothetical protein
MRERHSDPISTCLIDDVIGHNLEQIVSASIVILGIDMK